VLTGQLAQFTSFAAHDDGRTVGMVGIVTQVIDSFTPALDHSLAATKREHTDTHVGSDSVCEERKKAEGRRYGIMIETRRRRRIVPLAAISSRHNLVTLSLNRKQKQVRFNVPCGIHTNIGSHNEIDGCEERFLVWA
jgi:hypothetical protein